MLAGARFPTMAAMRTRLAVAGLPGWRRFPPNLFAIPFGLAGLSECWHAAALVLRLPAAVSTAIAAVAALAWVTLLAGYAGQGLSSALADFRSKTLSPFVALAPMTGMLLAAALSPYALTAGRVLVAVFLAATLLLGGLLTGEWVLGPLDHESAHPGYFLPTVAGGLVGAFCAAQVQLTALGAASFGVGMLCWLMIGSTVLGRLFFHRALPPALVPTLAIEVAPPAVAGIAYFALAGGRTDWPARALAGYAVLMIVVQVRLFPRFRALRFSAAFWAFAFSWAAVATDALDWIALRRPSGAAAWATLILTVITAFIGYIALRTVLLVVRGELLPPRARRLEATPVVPNESAVPVPASLAGQGDEHPFG